MSELSRRRVAGDESFVNGLMARMSLAEKVGQLNHPNAHGADTTGAGAKVEIEARIRRGEVGAVSAAADPTATRSLQEIAVNEAPHGIPLLFTLDVIHGHRTIFPLPLGLACSWDLELVRACARLAATEAAADGIALNWAPVLDVTWDARWGRAAEGVGEDPWLGGAIARASVAGFQDGALARADTVMATAKHFAGYGFCTAGRDYNAVDIGPYRMLNTVLPPFRAALDAGAGAVMAAFSDIAGIPATAHGELLRDLLRERWGFDGIVVSDYTAIMELVHHGVAADVKEAALLAFRAGVDLDLVSEAYVRHLPALVAEGRIAEAEVDAACRRVLTAKFRLGLFDDPFGRLRGDAAKRPTATSRRLARQAAVRACVLLRNDGTLPLRRGEGPIAVIGPLADSPENMQGTWAVRADPADSVSLLEGIRQAAGTEVLYAKGANIVDDANLAARLNVFGRIASIDPRPPDEMVAEAVALARRARIVIACVGEAKEHSGESATRDDIGLPGRQRALLRALAATGTPLVLVTLSGRPLALEWESAHAAAILHAWFPGSEAGHAVAELLFGDRAPSGRLAIGFPRHVGQCPMSYAEAPTGRPVDGVGIDVAGDGARDTAGRPVFRKFTTACRLEHASTPLYAFGFGLGYTEFAYGPPRLHKTQLKGADDLLEVSLTVQNQGARAGETVVQLYLGDPVASRSRPVRELKGFQRVSLAPGEAREVSFVIGTDALRFFRSAGYLDGWHDWEPGEFVVETGANAADLQATRVRWEA
jgi:beta-glucosidase